MIHSSIALALAATMAAAPAAPTVTLAAGDSVEPVGATQPAAVGSTSAVTQAPPAAVAPAPPSDLGLDAEYRRATGVFIAGLAGIGVGASTLLFVTLPAEAAYDRSVDKAADAEWVTEQSGPRREARVRRQVVVTSGLIGVGFLAAGTALTIVGASQRAKIRRLQRVSVAPVIGRTMAGMSATVQF